MENENIYFHGNRPEMAFMIPTDIHKVLEIGCGKGNFKTHFPDSIEYWGVEPNAEARAEAEQRFHKVLAGLYDDVEAELPEQYFDLIVCNDVIEHMPDHDAFLEQIKRKLAPGGRLLISIPNVRYFSNLYNLLVRKDWEYKDAGVLDRTHLRFFTEKSLLRTLEEHRFEILNFQRINLQSFKRIKMVEKFPFLRPCLQIAVGTFLGKDSLYLQFACLLKPKN